MELFDSQPKRTGFDPPKRPQPSPRSSLSIFSTQLTQQQTKQLFSASALTSTRYANRPCVLPQTRYRKDQNPSQQRPWIPPVDNLLKDTTDGSALAALLHFYCPALLGLEGRPGMTGRGHFDLGEGAR